MTKNQVKRSEQVQHSQQRVARPGLDVERVEFPNGLVLLLSENHTIPSVTISAIVRTGSRFEDDEKAGLASLTGELLDEGTTTRSSQQIAETIEATGGHLATFGDYQSSGAVVTVLSKDLGLGVEIASDVLINATFPEDKVHLHVERRVAQIRARLDQPRTLASDLFNEVVFEGVPQHHPSIGYEETVKTLTREDAEKFHRRYYVPDNTMLAIVGAIDKNEVKSRILDAFGEVEGVEHFEPPKITWPQRQTRPIEKLVNVAKEQVNIIIGHVGVERKNADYYKLLVMDTILGSSPGFTSRIPRVLRDEQGLAYTTFSNITSSAALDPGRFIAYIGTAPENLERAVSGLRKEIERIVEGGVSVDALEPAKLSLTVSFVFRFHRNSRIAELLLEAEIYGLGFDFLERYPQLIREVSVEDVWRVTQKYIDPDNLTTVVVGPLEETGRQVA